MVLLIDIPVDKLSELNLEGEFLWYEYTVVAYRFTHQVAPNSFPTWVRRAINFLLQRRIRNAYCWYRHNPDNDDRNVKAYVFNDDIDLEEMLYYVVKSAWIEGLEMEKEQYRMIQTILPSFK